MPTKSTWMPRERWEQLIMGAECALCDFVQKNPPKNFIDEYGITVTENDTGYWRLMRNQYVPGYSIFISKLHVTELYNLDDSNFRRYTKDIALIGKSIEEYYNPIKMNFTILGNSIPHLHTHIIPRYYGDDAPNEPIDPESKEKLIDDEKLKADAKKLQKLI